MITINPRIFKAYDIRGVVPDDITPATAYLIGQAYGQTMQNPGAKVVVGRDARNSGADLQPALVAGLQSVGIEVTDFGAGTTGMMYFAVGQYNFDGGIMVTASHNPGKYNGFKMVLAKAQPVFKDHGMPEVAQKVQDLAVDFDESAADMTPQTVEGLPQLTEDYLDFAANFVDIAALQKAEPIKVAINTNHGMAIDNVLRLVEKFNLPLQLSFVYKNIDGSYPQGRPDPLYPANQAAFSKVIKSSKSAFGAAFDGDADRNMFFDENGNYVDGYYISALMIKSMLALNPGGTIIYDPRQTRAVLAAIADNGGKAVPSQVGHSYIKQTMRVHDGVFCAENSGHIYFKDHWYCEHGMVPFLLMLEAAIKNQPKPFSAMFADLQARYVISGEINMTVDDKDAAIEVIKKAYVDAEINELDGVSVEYNDWRCNVRMSNTEPLLRLNLEAGNKEMVDAKVAEIMQLLGNPEVVTK